MKEFSLAYGTRSVSFRADAERFQTIARETEFQTPLTDVEIGDVLDSPIRSAPLEDLISTGESVLIVVSDATRATGSAQLVNLLVRRLIQSGVSPGNLAIIFATGIHRPVSPEEKLELLTPFIVQRVKVLDHDASDPSRMIDLGLTERGTRVMVNRALQDYDHVIIIGGVGFHYFAGFTGGRKSICPGLASATTIESTHMLALDFDKGGRRAGVGTGQLDGNAVHEECERVAGIIKPTFAINSVVDEQGRPVQLYAGHWRESHRKACLEYMSNHSAEIPSRRDLVIASCGGFPYDINVIQAHKTLDMAAQACNDGGTIIFVAECREGLGRSDFLKWFAESDSRALERRLQHSYEVNGQTAWALLTKAERFRVLLVSELAPDNARRMRLTPMASLDKALSEVGDSSEGYIIQRGASWLPLVRR
jgi:lactate racemase